MMTLVFKRKSGWGHSFPVHPHTHLKRASPLHSRKPGDIKYKHLSDFSTMGTIPLTGVFPLKQ